MFTLVRLRPFNILKAKQFYYNMTVSEFSTEGVSFTPKLQKDDPRLCDAIAHARLQKNSLDKPKTVILEGERLISDAIRSGGRLRFLYSASKLLLNSMDLSLYKDNVFYVPLRILKQFSLLKTCPGIIAIFDVPHIQRNPSPCQHSFWRPLPVILILDNIRDPGNMGALIRTAAGFGLSAVVASKGCVDVWNEKVLRAGMSAHFRVPIYSGLEWNQIEQLLRNQMKTMGISYSSPIKVYVADSSENSCPTGYDEPLESSYHFAVSYFADMGIMAPSTRSSESPVIALILGSEAHGLSSSAYHLCHRTHGCRIFIPCDPATRSLSVIVAAATILGEMQRQYLTRL